MIYLNSFLFLTALLLCWYGVYGFKPKNKLGELVNAATRRKEHCSVGDHRYTKPLQYLSLPTASEPSQLMVCSHCMDCGNYDTETKK